MSDAPSLGFWSMRLEPNQPRTLRLAGDLRITLASLGPEITQPNSTTLLEVEHIDLDSIQETDEDLTGIFAAETRKTYLCGLSATSFQCYLNILLAADEEVTFTSKGPKQVLALLDTPRHETDSQGLSSQHLPVQKARAATETKDAACQTATRVTPSPHLSASPIIIPSTHDANVFGAERASQVHRTAEPTSPDLEDLPPSNPPLHSQTSYPLGAEKAADFTRESAEQAVTRLTNQVLHVIAESPHKEVLPAEATSPESAHLPPSDLLPDSNTPCLASAERTPERTPESADLVAQSTIRDLRVVTDVLPRAAAVEANSTASTSAKDVLVKAHHRHPAGFPWANIVRTEPVQDAPEKVAIENSTVQPVIISSVSTTPPHSTGSVEAVLETVMGEGLTQNPMEEDTMESSRLSNQLVTTPAIGCSPRRATPTIETTLADSVKEDSVDDVMEEETVERLTLLTQPPVLSVITTLTEGGGNSYDATSENPRSLGHSDTAQEVTVEEEHNGLVIRRLSDTVRMNTSIAKKLVPMDKPE
ncbi:hypothetical protein SISSUDRAFT_1067473 [Sistotremastrum suecicum HHB10207 ss-3]|uniref:Nucleoplasmin-like domain-containing protein n=1 Tax=Sistotremastrum suecicum HHB10207 ss-3 TaxID=1314776 RepID=A0A165X2V8_9AGAM|nr:hypothetical protein SISSUDRAFT_1067473 [Sistotremastrum suecicum HHB10207 ss-3]